MSSPKESLQYSHVRPRPLPGEEKIGLTPQEERDKIGEYRQYQQAYSQALHLIAQETIKPQALRDERVMSDARKQAAENRCVCQEIRNEFFTANIRFIRLLAHRAVQPHEDEDEFVNQCALDFTNVLNTFDPDKGRFTTHLYSYVQRAIQKVRTQRQTFTSSTIAKFNTAKSRLASELGREPTPEEVTTELRLKKASITDRSQAARPIVYLSEPTAEGDDIVVADTIANHDPSFDPVQAFETAQSAKEVNRLLRFAQLNERERGIITMHCALDGDGKYSLQDIANKLGISKERVRQIEASALRKLRRVARPLPEYAWYTTNAVDTSPAPKISISKIIRAINPGNINRITQAVVLTNKQYLVLALLSGTYDGTRYSQTAAVKKLAELLHQKATTTGAIRDIMQNAVVKIQVALDSGKLTL